VLDSHVHESILLHDSDTIESAAKEEDEDGSRKVNVLTDELQALTLGRLKEFYLDTTDPVLGMTATGQPSTGPQNYTDG